MSSERNVYDPDPYEAQLEALRGLQIPEVDVDQLCSPAAVRILMLQWRVSVVELQRRREEIDQLRLHTARLETERSSLRVRLARTEGQAVLSWIRTIIGALFGFAGNMVLGNEREPLGWLLLGVSVLVLLVSIAEQVRRKENRHAED